jgi:ferritin-like metal-binding protein YciE
MSMDTLQDLFQDNIKDLYSAENQLLKALPKMAKAASSEELAEAFRRHQAETEEHVARLVQIAEMGGFKPGRKKCKGMEGLLEEGKEIMEEEGDGAVIDAGLIRAAQCVEHYEISAYGSARAMAERLGMKKAVTLLQKTLDEESATDEKLTALSEEVVLAQAAQGAE